MLFIITAILLSGKLRAQNAELVFERITTEQGLSQSSVRAIVQDSQGFLWLGTDDGLNKYDGYGFTIYKHDASDSTSISDNIIQTIFEDRSHALWIGAKNGLNLFDRATEEFTRFQKDPGSPGSVILEEVRGVLEDSSGTLWFLGFGQGLYRMRPQDRPASSSRKATIKFTRFSHDLKNPESLSSNYVTTILQDRSGALWIGTLGGGLNRFDARPGTFTRYQHNPVDPNSLSSDHVVALCEDETGDLWIGTYGGGLCRLRRNDRALAKFVSYRSDPHNPTGLSHNNILAILPARKNEPGTLWIGTFNGGLCRLNPSARQSPVFFSYKHDPQNPASISNDRILALCEDRSGNLWAGTTVGLNKAVTQPVKFERWQHEPSNPNSLSHQNVNAIWEARSGDLWVGTDAGLDHFDVRTQHFENFKYDPKDGNSLNLNYVKAIREDRAGRLWVGTFGAGLARWRPHAQQSGPVKKFVHDPANPASLASNFVSTVYEDHTSRLWIGTTNGLSRFEDAGESFFNYRHTRESGNPSANNIVALYEDRQGMLWIGTYADGVYRLDPRSGEFISYRNDPQNANSLSHNSVISIYEDHERFLWFGTVAGLNKFDPHTQSFTRYDEKDGLANAFIYGILSDDEGNLWLSTNNGLSRFNDRLPRGMKFRKYDVRDGLQNNEFNVGAYHRGRSGALYFGGINGFNRFFPHLIRDNPHAPPIALTAFRKFNEGVALDTAISVIKTITLSHRDDFISFDFAALDYTQPGRNQYSHKMEGFDKDWIYSGTRRYASYTNLDPGQYVFRVKGANSDGVWSEAGTSVKIVITPPFWGTWWFRILAVAAITGLLALIYRHRVARLLEMERLRVRIASDLHDDIGSTLTKISLHSELIQHSTDVGEVKESLRKIGTMSRELIMTMSDIVWSIDARNDTVGDLLDRMREFAAGVLQAKSVAFTFEIADLALPHKLPVNIRQNIYLIFKEAINNITKHAEASCVKIQLKNANGAFNMTIRDDGKAPRDDERLTGQGLRNMTMRAKRIGGRLEIFREDGYVVSLTAPALR
jgi:ligand-binding sensor domain-containing protein/signal transduction histidine kinase